MNKFFYVLNFCLIGEVNDLLLMKFDLNGIVIFIGLVCIVGNIEFFYVLEVMYGEDMLILKEFICISFGLDNIEEDIYYFFD